MSDNRATDTRPPFFSIEEAIVDKYELTPLAGWLYVVIARHINRKTNEAFPSLNRLAKLAGMSRASVIRNIKILEEKKLIEVTREIDYATKEKSVNHYKLLSATTVVSDSNKGSVTQQLGVVSDVDINHKNLNHKNLTKEKESANADKIATPSKKNGEVAVSHSNSPKVAAKNPSLPNGAKPLSPQKAKQNALHEALLTSFELKVETITRSEDRKYWTAAAELARIDFPAERVHELYWYIRRKADVEGWKSWTVMAMVSRVGEFLRDNPSPKVLMMPEPEPLAPAAGAENVRDYSVEGRAMMDALIAAKRGKK